MIEKQVASLGDAVADVADGASTAATDAAAETEADVQDESKKKAAAD